MSELQRSRVYSWIREQHDEATAEYFMSCLAPAPLSDLVTKDYLTAELSRYATKEDMEAGFATLRSEHAIQRAEDQRQRAEDRAEYAAQRAEDRRENAAQRAEDRRAALHRHYWQLGTMFGLATPILLRVFEVIG